MKDSLNRRLTKRFDLIVPAVITQIGREKVFYSQLCLTRDISSQGAYIGLTEPIPDDDEIEVQLLYTLKNDAGIVEYVQMTANGSVIRRETNGLAVNFEGHSTLKSFHIKDKNNSRA